MSSHPVLTELEGAVLTEIACRGCDTAYRVRRAMQTSPSSYWRGSAGAVSPAIRRLVSAGLIATEPHGRRKGLRLSITDAGTSALRAWAANLTLACGVGFDPFRLRSGFWVALPAAERRTFFGALEEMIQEQLRTLEMRRGDPVDEVQTELAVALQITRLDWIRKKRRAVTEVPLPQLSPASSS